MNKKLQKIIDGIKDTAKQLGIHANQVTLAQFFKFNDGIKEWDIRSLGGFSSIKNTHFPMDGKDLASIKQQKETVKYIRELENKLSDVQLFERNIKDAINEATHNLKLDIIKVAPLEKKDTKKRNLTMELMISDVHYGKKTKDFNIKVCVERMKKLTTVFLKELEDSKQLFNVDKIIIALLGDIIESYSMHNLESAAGCEFGNSKQIQYAIESLFRDVIVPIAKTGHRIDIPCVTGNHDRTETHRTMNQPGSSNVTWIVYNSLKLLCEVSGLTNVKFDIPEGSYTTLKIYNNVCLYEHGDNVKALTKVAFETLINKRSKQTGMVIDFARFGHWHEYACYDRGRIVVNESVCGQDSYAAVLGFNSTAGQTINYYIETKDRPNCFYKSFPVYLG